MGKAFEDRQPLTKHALEVLSKLDYRAEPVCSRRVQTVSGSAALPPCATEPGCLLGRARAKPSSALFSLEDVLQAKLEDPRIFRIGDLPKITVNPNVIRTTQIRMVENVESLSTKIQLMSFRE
jgi:hypothetical protein